MTWLDEPLDEYGQIGSGFAAGNDLLQLAKELRELAKVDRPMAVEKAKVLQAWTIEDSLDADVLSLVNTLVAFPRVGQLEDFLTQHGVSSRDDHAAELADVTGGDCLTPADYLLRYGRVIRFDPETGSFPVNHDHLCKALIKHSSGNIRHAIFDEVPPREYGNKDMPYHVIGKLNGRRYCVEAQNLGDYYDVWSVLRLLNAMAILNEVEDRFVVLPSDDQAVNVLLLTSALAETLIEKGIFPLAKAHRVLLEPGQAEVVLANRHSG